MSSSWHPLISEDQFPAEGKLAAKLAGWHVLVGRGEHGFHAVNDRCTHQAALLSGGRIRRGAVMCPLHGARFELASGTCIGGAAVTGGVLALDLSTRTGWAYSHDFQAPAHGVWVLMGGI